jgi:hypothetical protein
MVDQAIWSKKMSNGTRRIPVSPEQVQSTFSSDLFFFCHYYHIVICHLTMGIILKKALLGDFIVV